MHILQRFIVTAVLLVALVPLMTLALTDLGERNKAVENLDQAIERAVGEYNAQRYVKGVNEGDAEKARVRLGEVARLKGNTDIQLAAYRKVSDQLKERFGLDGERKGGLEKVPFKLFSLYESYPMHDAAPTNLKSLMLSFVPVISGKQLREHVLNSKLSNLKILLTEVGENEDTVASLEQSQSSLQKEYDQVAYTIDRAEKYGEIGGGRTDEIKRVMEEVHAQVLRMQSDLARIDARLREKTQRKLIEKGLMDPKTGDNKQGIVPFTPKFTWPAYGPISATFMQPSYQQYFGIPHRGMDIVIGQGSPIVSAADGVVFLTKNGGVSGYSYILIGHRGGYATLYGHLSHISVHAGQDVTAGEIIGASGGTPRTRGAGPTTTGAHLHFEVIKGGVNVNPRGMLP
ncbi:peptidoglycan DD-metalloendopeptidase family protein [Patescibacteria group bacterium]|nr:peptidoglycan DD-metalloendopeptidase family protein [Patescibacteria group bacterium]